MSNQYECCSDPTCESGLRNRYFQGKRLTPAALQTEQAYNIQRRRLINRSIHGWGVVRGFDDLEPNAQGFVISKGLALDQCGRELCRIEVGTIEYDKIIFFNKKGKKISVEDFENLDNYWNPSECSDLRNEKDGSGNLLSSWLLSAHYAEVNMNHVAGDPCQPCSSQWDHVCETVRFSLREMGCKECNDEENRKTKDDTKSSQTDDSLDDDETHRSPRCLCELSKKWEFSLDQCDSLCEHEEPCGGIISVDYDNPVPLTCIKFYGENDPLKNEEIKFVEFDHCGPRQLVKHNELLFDLIPSCDLTTISKIGWFDWHRKEVDLEEFIQGFKTDNGQYISEKFTMEFSREVDVGSLNFDCFSMTVLFHDTNSGWWKPHRVPIVDLKMDPDSENNGLTKSVQLVFDNKWGKDELNNEGYSTFDNGVSPRVEIEVYGDFIIDRNGQPVDANAVGLRAVPSGNGSPSGTFRSSFTIVNKKKNETNTVGEPNE